MIQLRPYQQEAIDALYSWFMSNPSAPLIDLPTGTGKSVVIAGFVQRALTDYPETRIVIATHVKELIDQNFMALMRSWPECPAGIYSASVGRRDGRAQVCVVGIQSVYKAAEKIGHTDLLIVDECHLMPPKGGGMYQRFMADLKLINPHVKLVGFTATPYRLDSGHLAKGKDALFGGTAYRMSVLDAINQGYLSPVTNKPTETKLDTSGVAKRGGDYVEAALQAAVDQDHLTTAAVGEIVNRGQDRGSWLLFCAGVDHAEHVAKAVADRGYSAACVTGKTPSAERDRIIRAFKSGELRCLTNANVLTTGFDAPGVDLIGMLRPTLSTSLYVQMIGRGTRLANGKDNCLVLDFAGNVATHGPIDAPDVREVYDTDGEGEAPIKVCPECDEICYAGVRHCPACGHEFPPPELKIASKADNKAALLSSHIVEEWLDVTDVRYSRHEKSGSPDSLCVTYQCGLTVRHKEWVCLEHAGFPRQKAAHWWLTRLPGKTVPQSVDQALEWKAILPKPARIAVKKAGKYFEITGVEW